MRKEEILNDPRRPRPAPAEFAGQWVAWNHDHSAIIAHGKTLAEVTHAIDALGQPEALLERVRRPDEILVGSLGWR
jgi:hypothetical protein